MNFYQKETEELVKEYHINLETGFTEAQVAQSRAQSGENKLPEDKKVSYLQMFLSNFKEPIVIVLMVGIALTLLSAFLSFKVEHNPQHGLETLYEAIAIFILIIINAILGFYQELRSLKSMKALKEMNGREALVLRDGTWKKVKSEEIVTFDLVKVMTGDFIEADVRWVQASELQVVESHLTGESTAIDKNINVIVESVEIGDQINMGFSGSMVTNGTGIGVVTDVGESTELGKIAVLLQEVEPKTSPLQANINHLTKLLMGLSFGVIAFTFIVGIIRSGSLSLTSLTSVLSTSIALAVASIPDALPAVLSIVLTIGAMKMSKNNGLIKSLTSVETLGATSFICSDKTGTLTKNEMTVVTYYSNGYFFDVSGLGYSSEGSVTVTDTETEVFSDNVSADFISGAVLCNDSFLREDNGKLVPIGNPTEIALTVLGEKLGTTKESLLKSREIVRTFPFTSSRKMMTVIVKENEKFIAYTKGAPEIILSKATGSLNYGELIDISTVKKDYIEIIDDFAVRALRTLAVAQREVSEEEAINGEVESIECDLILTGIVGIEDPAREEVKPSVKTLQDANINVVMITGDHEKTAKAIALKLGIIKDKHEPVLTGKELELLSDKELGERVQSTHVYARVSPKHKQRIVRELQGKGEIVAMTGDGVNDAPALKSSDIGIAMGITGTDVTKDSADLILLDDKFTTIEHSVESGRTIYGNIKNFIRHELTTNIAEVLSLLLGLLFFTQAIGQVNSSVPTLTAIMILWVNMISDAVPSFALAYDTAEVDIMQAKPRNPNESILSNYTWSRVLIRGVIMGLLVYIMFIWAAKNQLPSSQCQTVAFLTLVFGQLWHVFDARSNRTLYRRNPLENKHLVAAVLFAGLSSILVTLIPFFQVVMGTDSLAFETYIFIIIIAGIPTLVLSAIKEFFNIKII